MSKRGSAGGRAASRKKAASETEEGFVMVSPDVTDASSTTPRHSAEEEEEYERKLDVAHRAQFLGLDLPPIAPPGHKLQIVKEEQKPTYWTLLFRRAENRSALYQLYVTTALMVTIPLGLMALTYYTIFSGMSDERRLSWSGFAGVLGVNIVALGFGAFAYFEKSDDDDEEEEVDDAAAKEEAKRKMWSAWEAEQEAGETRENRERLQAIRDAHQAKQASEASSSDDVPSTEESESKQLRSRTARNKSTHDSAIDEAETEARPVARVTRSRSRSKKA